MNEFQKQAAITALRVMFEGMYFNISTVDECIKISECFPPNKKDYLALRALHCVHFSDMSQELRQLTLAKTMQIFETPKFDTEVIDAFDCESCNHGGDSECDIITGQDALNNKTCECVATEVRTGHLSDEYGHLPLDIENYWLKQQQDYYENIEQN